MLEKVINLMSQSSIHHKGGCLCDEGYFTATEFVSEWAFGFYLIIVILTPMLIKLLWNKGEKFDRCYDDYRNKRDFTFTMIILTPMFLIASWFFSYIVVWGAIGVLIFQIIDFFSANKHVELWNYCNKKIHEKKQVKNTYKNNLLKDL